MSETATTICPACKSQNIIRAVGISKTADSGRIGLSFRVAGVLVGTSPIVADLCDDCGMIVKMYVLEVGKPWIQRG